MNEKQKKLFMENIDLAEMLAMNATCVEADCDELQRESERMLAVAVMNYDPSKNGMFEEYATSIIKRALNRIVNSNGNALFAVHFRRVCDEERDFFNSGEEVLRVELQNLHKSI